MLRRSREKLLSFKFTLCMCHVFVAANFQSGRRCLPRSVHVRMLRREKLLSFKFTLCMCYVFVAANCQSGRRCLPRSVNARMLRREKLFNWTMYSFNFLNRMHVVRIPFSLPGARGRPNRWIQGAMLHMFCHTQTWSNTSYQSYTCNHQDTPERKYEREKRRYFELKAKEAAAERTVDAALARSAQLFARWNATDPAGPPSAACVDSTNAMNHFVQQCLNRRSEAYNKRMEQQKKVLNLKEKRTWLSLFHTGVCCAQYTQK